MVHQTSVWWKNEPKLDRNHGSYQQFLGRNDTFFLVITNFKTCDFESRNIFKPWHFQASIKCKASTAGTVNDSGVSQRTTGLFFYPKTVLPKLWTLYFFIQRRYYQYSEESIQNGVHLTFQTVFRHHQSTNKVSLHHSNFYGDNENPFTRPSPPIPRKYF